MICLRLTDTVFKYKFFGQFIYASFGEYVAYKKVMRNYTQKVENTLILLASKSVLGSGRPEGRLGFRRNGRMFSMIY
jgi:hypothetical protein